MDKAIRNWEVAADQGYAKARSILGNVYDEGRCVHQIDKQALACYRKAAGQGHSRAQCNPGCMHEQSHGVVQSPKEAAV